MNQKHWWSIIHVTVGVNFLVENAISIKSWITTSADMSVRI